MIYGIDHLVILVNDLEAGIEQYRNLGFTVTPGGKHPRGTHNALVTFLDGSYFELIAFWEPDYAEHRWHSYIATGGGLIDHALRTDDLSAEIAGAGVRNVPYDGPHDGARTRPDGVELKWLTAMEIANEGQGLPFMIEDLTDRELRVPGGEATTHANGVRGIHSLILAVNDLETTAAKYAALVNNDPASRDTASHTDQDTIAVTIPVGEQMVELHQPEGTGQMTEQLVRRGNGPYAVKLYGAENHDFAPAEAGNARLSVVAQ